MTVGRSTARAGGTRGAAAGMLLLAMAPGLAGAADPPPAIAELLDRPYLDDYQSSVVLGWRIVVETERYAARYAGNRMRCVHCHLDGGTRPGALPLDVAGLYPKWRAKNGQLNDLGRRIRECFVYSLDGVMPPAEAPEVTATAAYIHHLSRGRVIGDEVPGRGVPTLAATGYDPNPADGREVYRRQCAPCHGESGGGTPETVPPVWGSGSFNQGSGMYQLPLLAGFIHANMPPGEGARLTPQQAWDVAAFLRQQLRPADPRESRLGKMVEKLIRLAAPGS
ncbi:MAG: c-type cytochrome [Magnetococcales bacterium]|nr:c-type cytochrome [Magnetococcales bacterium]